MDAAGHCVTSVAPLHAVDVTYRADRRIRDERVPAERLVQCDAVLRRSALRLHQHLLHRIIGSLRVEQVQIAVDAGAVARLRRARRHPQRRLAVAGWPQAAASIVTRRASASETSRNAVWTVLLIGRERGVALRFAETDIRAARSGLEDRVARRSLRPASRARRR